VSEEISPIPNISNQQEDQKAQIAEETGEKETTPEEIALQKVINFAERGMHYRGPIGLGFHELATGPDRWWGDRLHIGILYAEQVLNQGILSHDLAKRAGIERSPYGYSPDDPTMSYTGSNAVALYPASTYLRHKEGGFPMEFHEFSFICKYDRSDYHQAQEDSGEVEVKSRIRPNDIVGVAIYSKYLNAEFSGMGPRDRDLDEYPEYKKQAERIAKAVGIDPPSWSGDLPDHEDFVNRLKKALGYENVVTVGDYLKRLGNKYTIPVYTDDEGGLGLYWPEKISSADMGKFPSPDEIDWEAGNH